MDKHLETHDLLLGIPLERRLVRLWLGLCVCACVYQDGVESLHTAVSHKPAETKWCALFACWVPGGRDRRFLKTAQHYLNFLTNACSRISDGDTKLPVWLRAKFSAKHQSPRPREWVRGKANCNRRSGCKYMRAPVVLHVEGTCCMFTCLRT